MTESLADGFEPVSLDQWSEAATKGDENVALMTLLENGVEAKWLYTPEDSIAADPSGLPGKAPFVRGTRAGRHWQIRQEQTQPDRVKANKEILEDLLAAAINDAVRKVEKQQQDGIGKLTAGMPLPPGFKF